MVPTLWAPARYCLDTLFSAPPSVLRIKAEDVRAGRGSVGEHLFEALGSIPVLTKKKKKTVRNHFLVVPGQCENGVKRQNQTPTGTVCDSSRRHLQTGCEQQSLHAALCPRGRLGEFTPVVRWCGSLSRKAGLDSDLCSLAFHPSGGLCLKRPGEADRGRSARA